MRSSFIVLLLIILSLFPRSIFAVSGLKTNHLFFIERSKNKNLVQYDIRLTEDRDLPDPSPISVYWILGNGRREELNSIERKYVYGIVRQEKLAENKFRVILAGLKGLEIIVERLNDSFKAMVSIDGRESILERIYIKSEEKLAGPPKILYIDLFGRTKETGLPIKERIDPK
ncbi:MAG TPA: DUF4833 domain-containing protein [Thermodesulfobacteriota bacterium]|jgi:hypothetical protein|nr:DUF4833 domain-containing protein [Thermodesulfobacteriota bacterium]